MANTFQTEFDQARTPLKPLEYAHKDKAQTREFMIDYSGENPTYHMYIVDPEDKTKIIDLSAKLLKEGYNSDDVTIEISGLEKPISLKNAIEFIYKRFVHIYDLNGFDPDKDMRKILDPTNKTILLQDPTGNYAIPVTRASAVFDEKGISIQDKLNKMSRIGFTTDHVMVINDNQSVFEITYPFADYISSGNYFELRVGTTFIAKDRYQIIDNVSNDGKSYSGTITFFNDTFESGRRIDILYIYNVSVNAENDINVVDGGTIANRTVTSDKLVKISDSFMLPDSTSVASSKAIYDAFASLFEALSSAECKVFFVKDTITYTNNKIVVSIMDQPVTIGNSYILLNILTASSKMSDVELEVVSTNQFNGKSISHMYNITLPNNGISSGKLLKVLVNDKEAIVLSVVELKRKNARYIHYAKELENKIPFDRLEYDASSVINVYRNGLKLFEDLDYSIDYDTQVINLFVSTTERERIIIESESISY